MEIALDQDLLCGRCGYNLRGVSADRCPECGGRFDRRRLIDDLIPWEQRRYRGRLRCYWRTVWLVSFHPSRAAQLVRQPVGYRDAVRFRLLTSVGSFLVAWAVVANWAGSAYSQNTPIGECLRNTPFMVISFIGALLGWFGAVGATGYFFHPRRLGTTDQNRCVALGNYACAPLAWLPLVALVWASAISLKGDGSDAVPFWTAVGDYIGWGLFVLATALSGLTIFQWWRVPLVLLKKTTGCGPARAVVAGFLLPLLFVLLPAVCLAFLQFTVNYAVLIWTRF